MTETNIWTVRFPALTIEVLPNGNLRMEDTAEDSESHTAIVDVHPAQLRSMAERLGMIREVSASMRRWCSRSVSTPSCSAPRSTR